jgi:hypothetical protein
MATIRLGRYELEEYDLPKVCLRCGARATHYKSKNFSWYPPWAFLVLGVLGALIFTKRATMPVPLCDKHKWHWGGRTALILLSLLALVVLLFGAIAIASAKEELAPFVYLPLFVLFLAWLVFILVLSATTIRPTEITDKSITLRGVSDKFVEAMEEVRRGEDDEEEDDRPRRRTRDDDEDDRPRAKRRPAKEEDDGGYYDPDAKRRRPASDAYEEGDR